LVGGLWAAALSARVFPDKLRRELGDKVHSGLVAAGRVTPAARVSGAMSRHTKDGGAGADVHLRQVTAEIALGTPTGLEAAVKRQLDRADAAYAKGDLRRAAASIQTVGKTLFDRRLHFDRLTSPLADDPEAFLRAWRQSAAVQAMAAPRGRREPAAANPSDRPVRLLMATYGNHGFIELIRRHFAEAENVELRFIDPTGKGDEVALMGGQLAMIEHALGGQQAYAEKVADWLQPHIDWADVVFIDWCAALATLFSMIDPGSTRIIVRLHSFEAFSLWPHLVDFSRVDDLVFVSDHLRDLAVAAVPGMIANGTRLHVVTNAMDLRGFYRDKKPDARFTLGVVGIKAVAKDPRWAVEVLRHLRRHDDRYRLVFYGTDLNADATPDTRRYWDQFLADIRDLERAGAVVRTGHVADMPSALVDVGVVLSSSVRESFHCGLVEGAASGAIPIVRDWPFFAGRPASAASLFPDNWVVRSPHEAADRIIGATNSDAQMQATGSAAAEHAISTWDWQIVKHDFDKLILGEDSVAGGNFQ